jgi:uncharacterized protein (TIGR03492 family)
METNVLPKTKRSMITKLSSHPTMTKRILCLSNGHGEDSIAVVLLKALQAYDVELIAMPVVGQGTAYANLQIPIIGPRKTMPSGGFIYMDARQFWRDISEGLVTLTLKQLAMVGKLAPDIDLILAVGDIVVQVGAFYSQKPHFFVGTAKSDYYIGGKPSVYNGIERWLMSQSRCEAVFPRDRITTLNLQKLGITRSYDLGNPMMDGLEAQGFAWEQVGLTPDAKLVVLLPGSRPPEAHRNFLILLQAALSLGEQPFPLSLVAALAPALQGKLFIQDLHQVHPDLAWVEQAGTRVYLVWRAFADCLQQASLVLAMTGTGTEQAVGLGKPVISFAGDGPQFNYRFAEAQTRLLGSSVLLCPDPQAVAPLARQCLTDHTLRERIAHNGLERMGTPGAAQRIAAHIMEPATRVIHV